MGHDFEPLSARIIEAALAVHKALGPGFLDDGRIEWWDEIELITKARKYENTKMLKFVSQYYAIPISRTTL